jgi:hypothetical protein
LEDLLGAEGSDDVWDCVTWEGNRRAQRREFMALSLRDKILRLEEMEQVGRVVSERAGQVTGAPAEAARDLLRHTLATLAYRGENVFRDAPSDFARLRVAESSRTPGENLVHLGDLLAWVAHLATGKHLWRMVPPGDWDADVARFFGIARARRRACLYSVVLGCGAGGVSGPGCRRVDARRSDRHAAADGRGAGTRRKLCARGDPDRGRGTDVRGPENGVLRTLPALCALAGDTGCRRPNPGSSADD